ncbi:MAG TPA: glycosyltransferase family A protein [Solirubrobacterales bacterium]|nr:glycosyltransferase family A protein [Solirubrobacterales bacterium]
MNDPAVSVIIPAFEAECYIGDAIESALAQTLPPDEVIVVDDGSTDSTPEIASGYEGVRVIRQENRGPSAARNAGFAASTGELIAFHDSDDLMEPRRLELQASYLAAHRGCGCVVGRQRVKIEEGSKKPFWARGKILRLNNPLGEQTAPPDGEGSAHTMTMLVRRGSFLAVGPFDEEMQMAEDIDWIFRALELEIGVDVLDDIVLVRRIHADNMTHNEKEAARMLFVVFKRRMDRRRAKI